MQWTSSICNSAQRSSGRRDEEVRGRLTNADGAFADITSFVACPAGMDPCDPATAPAGTIYTYVHVILSRGGQ